MTSIVWINLMMMGISGVLVGQYLKHPEIVVKPNTPYREIKYTVLMSVIVVFGALNGVFVVLQLIHISP